MKVVILAAGDSSKYFPLFIDKPKCLYYQNNESILLRAIKNITTIVKEEDIIIVGGYKFSQIKKFCEKNNFKGKLVNNKEYKKSGIYSLRKGIENINEDVIFYCADEKISNIYLEKMNESTKRITVLSHEIYPYYSTSLFKMKKEELFLIQQEKYVNTDFYKELIEFLNNDKELLLKTDLDTGLSIGYMIWDMIRQIGKLDKPVKKNNYFGNEIEMIEYKLDENYYSDLDSFRDTDEYKNLFYRLYFEISNPLYRLYLKIKGKK